MEAAPCYTREVLKRLCIENREKIRQQKIQKYVFLITERVLCRNNDGHGTCIYYFEKALKEPQELIIAIADRLAEVFVDSEVTQCTGDSLFSDYILVDWSSRT